MLKVLTLLLLAALVQILTIQRATAQGIQIEIGSDRQILSVLEQNGYTQSRITRRSLTIVRAEACKGGTKYLVKVSVLGKITSATETGKCAPERRQAAFGERQARKILRDQGYRRLQTRTEDGRVLAVACRDGGRYEILFSRRGRLTDRRRVANCPRRNRLTPGQVQTALRNEGFRRIEIVNSSPPDYVAEGCREGQRYRLRLTGRGEVTSVRDLGQCRDAIAAGDVPKLLREKGYNRVEMTRTRDTPFVARACRGSTKYEIQVGRRGRIRDTRSIGTCRQVINPRSLGDVLASRGYERIRILRRDRAPYLAEACRSGRLLEIRLDRFGDIVREEPIGRCVPLITKQDLAAKLGEEGYLNVEVNRRDDGWRVLACRGEARLRLRYDGYGKKISERPEGTCRSQSVLDVLTTLESRGARRVELVVEGCFRQTRYKWRFDRLGNRVGREAIGNC